MGYVSSFADEINSGAPTKAAKGFWNSPFFAVSMVALSAGITFFSVKALLESDLIAPQSPTAIVSESDEEYYPVTTTTTTTTTTAATTTTTKSTTTTTTTTTAATTTTTAASTTATTAATTAATTTTAPAPASVGRFSKSYLLSSANYPEVHIPGITLPQEYEDGLLDPEAVFWLVNELRSNNGLEPYKRGSADLGRAADIRAEEILNDFSQTRPNGTSYRTVFGQVSIDCARCLESVGYGQYTAEHLVSDWLDSSNNKSNILNTDCTYIYITCEVGDDNIPVWVMLGYKPAEQ